MGSLNSRAKTKASRRRHSDEKYNFLGLMLLLLCVLCLFFLVLPGVTGSVGKSVNGVLSKLLGLSSYLLVLSFTIWSLRIFLKKIELPVLIDVIGHILLFISLSLFLGLLGLIINKPLAGEWGLFLKYHSVYYFGIGGSYILVLIIVIAGLTLSTAFSLPAFLAWLVERISQDLREFSELRNMNKKNRPSKPQPELIPKLPKIQTIEDLPKIRKQPMGSRESEPEKVDTGTIVVIPKILEKNKEMTTKKKGSVDAKKNVSESNTGDDTVKNDLEPAASAFQNYNLPSLDLLENIVSQNTALVNEHDINQRAMFLLETLKNFEIDATIVGLNPGPVVTRYDIQPAPGVKIQSIVTLSNDIALSMRASSIRVIAPIPGKAAVGIEIPNQQSKIVGLRDIIESEDYSKITSKLVIALGKTTDGLPYVTDLIPMPHLLIAGSTGSGKSVCLHSIIMSILFRSKPDEVKFLMIDPKQLELPGYNGIPHLYDPNHVSDEVKVVTNPKDAARSLEKLIKVMEFRYKKYAQAAVRNIEGYNKYAEKNGIEKDYYIVVIIDELADLILVAQKEIEESIMRLAQMARAVGIHLILATQRPSVDVITGVIKANLPSRIAFQVLSKIDSRVILDTQGAEDLLGKGDMLFLPPGAPKPIRLQGGFVSEKEVERVANYIREQAEPAYTDILGHIEEQQEAEENEETRELLLAALKLMKSLGRVSGDILRGDNKIGHKYGVVLALLERDRFVYKPEGTKSWKINMEAVDDYLQK
ncbi:MAG: DNA translocase FtsK 4TM domain-containing protein, partial [Elusimicrobiota bacterium]